MKGFMGLSLAILLLVGIVSPLVAATFGSYEYEINGGEVTITKFLCDTPGAVIPAEIGGLPVTTIGDRAFKDCESLTSVAIPDSVTTVGEYAFSNCDALNNATIPNSITNLGNFAFKGSGLTNVIIPNSITSIGENVFAYCQYLNTVTIPNSVTSIGRSAFNSCGLTSITISDNVTSIGDSAFAHCSNLTSVTIESGVTYISGGTFSDCTSLTSVSIPNSVTTIREGAFANCSSLPSLFIPNSVTSIGFSAFWDCISLTSMTIPDGVTSIGNYAFRGCISLTSFSLPDSVTSIGTSTFKDCHNLEHLTIGSGIPLYGLLELLKLDSLTDINARDDNPYFSSIDGVLFDKSLTTLIRFPIGVGGVYHIPNSVTSISNSAFSNCSNLTILNIPNSVTTIGDEAFWNCTSLTDMTIGYGVESIASRAWGNCFVLGQLIFLGNPPNVGDMVFYQNPQNQNIYYLEGNFHWPDTFEGKTTTPINPLWLWGRHTFKEENGYIISDTGDWLGRMDISLAPWVWCESVPCWFNIPEQTASTAQGWVYPPNQDNLQIVQVDGTNWGYSFALDKWLYLTASGWVYMV